MLSARGRGVAFPDAAEFLSYVLATIGKASILNGDEQQALATCFASMTTFIPVTPVDAPIDQPIPGSIPRPAGPVPTDPGTAPPTESSAATPSTPSATPGPPAVVRPLPGAPATVVASGRSMYSTETSAATVGNMEQCRRLILKARASNRSISSGGDDRLRLARDMIKDAAERHQAFRSFWLQTAQLVLSSVLLPVLTALLGYIFGKSVDGRSTSPVATGGPKAPEGPIDRPLKGTVPADAIMHAEAGRPETVRDKAAPAEAPADQQAADAGASGGATTQAVGPQGTADPTISNVPPVRPGP